MKKLTIALCILTFAALGANAQSAAESSPSTSGLITFRSAFVSGKLPENFSPTMNFADFEKSAQKSQIENSRLDHPLLPVSFGETARMTNQTEIFDGTKITTRGIRQNVNVKFAGRSADILFVYVSINDQPEQLVQIRENEIGFVNAGLLDAANKNSQGYLAFQVQFNNR